jgi:hypothetical protein
MLTLEQMNKIVEALNIPLEHEVTNLFLELDYQTGLAKVTLWLVKDGTKLEALQEFDLVPSNISSDTEPTQADRGERDRSGDGRSTGPEAAEEVDPNSP